MSKTRSSSYLNDVFGAPSVVQADLEGQFNISPSIFEPMENLDYLQDYSYTPRLGAYDGGIDPLTMARANTQSDWSKFGNTIVRGGAKALISAVEPIGHLVDVQQWVTDVNEVEDEYGNWFNQLLKSAEESLDKAMPIYTKENEPTLLSKDWWFKNGDQIIKSIGYFVPAMGMTSAATGLLKALGTASKVSKVLAPVMSATAMNYSEHMISATEAFKTNKEAYYNKLIKDNPKMDMDAAMKQAKMQASEDAEDIIVGGKFNIIFNAMEYGTMFKALNRTSRALEGGTKKLYSGLLKDIALSSGSEYAEEVTTGFLESEATRKMEIATGLVDEDGSSGASRYINRLGTYQSLTEGISGALGGGGMQIASQIGGSTNMTTVREAAKENAAVLGDVKSFNDITRSDFIELLRANASVGTYDQVFKNLDMIDKVDAQEAKVKGYSDDYKAKVFEFKEIAAQFEADYNNINRQHPDDPMIATVLLNNKTNAKIGRVEANKSQEEIKELNKKYLDKEKAHPLFDAKSLVLENKALNTQIAEAEEMKEEAKRLGRTITTNETLPEIENRIKLLEKTKAENITDQAREISEYIAGLPEYKDSETMPIAKVENNVIQIHPGNESSKQAKTIKSIEEYFEGRTELDEQIEGATGRLLKYSSIAENSNNLYNRLNDNPSEIKNYKDKFKENNEFIAKAVNDILGSTTIKKLEKARKRYSAERFKGIYERKLRELVAKDNRAGKKKAKSKPVTKASETGATAVAEEVIEPSIPVETDVEVIPVDEPVESPQATKKRSDDMLTTMSNVVDAVGANEARLQDGTTVDDMLQFVAPEYRSIDAITDLEVELMNAVTKDPTNADLIAATRMLRTARQIVREYEAAKAEEEEIDNTTVVDGDLSNIAMGVVENDKGLIVKDNSSALFAATDGKRNDRGEYVKTDTDGTIISIDGKITDGAASIAYLAKNWVHRIVKRKDGKYVIEKYTSSNLKNPTQAKVIETKKVNTETELRFTVDTKYKLMAEETEVESYKSLTDDTTDAEYIEIVPIIIDAKVDGKWVSIGYVHTLNWILANVQPEIVNKDKTVTNNMEIQIKAITETRKAIVSEFKKNNKSVTGKVIFKSSGIPIVNYAQRKGEDAITFNRTGKPRVQRNTVANNLPKVKKVVIVQSNKFKSSPTTVEDNVINNNTKGKISGTVWTIVEDSRGEKYALPAMQPKIGSNKTILANILNGVDVFFSDQDLTAINDYAEAESGIPLFGNRDMSLLDKYLAQYLNMSKPRYPIKLDPTRKIGNRNATKAHFGVEQSKGSGNYSFLFGHDVDGIVYRASFVYGKPVFNRHMGDKIDTISKEAFMNAFRETLLSRDKGSSPRFSTKLPMLGANASHLEVALSRRKGNVVVNKAKSNNFKTYTDFVTDKLYTKYNGKEVDSDGKPMYFDQANVKFEIDPVDKTITKVKKDGTTVTNKVEDGRKVRRTRKKKEFKNIEANDKTLQKELVKFIDEDSGLIIPELRIEKINNSEIQEELVQDIVSRVAEFYVAIANPLNFEEQRKERLAAESSGDEFTNVDLSSFNMNKYLSVLKEKYAEDLELLRQAKKYLSDPYGDISKEVYDDVVLDFNISEDSDIDVRIHWYETMLEDDVWSKLVKISTVKLYELGLTLTGEIDTEYEYDPNEDDYGSQEEIRDRVEEYDRYAKLKRNPKNTATVLLKLAIASMTRYDKLTEYAITNVLGRPVSQNPSQFFGKLLDNLLDTATNPKEMMERLGQLADSDINYEDVWDYAKSHSVGRTNLINAVIMHRHKLLSIYKETRAGEPNIVEVWDEELGDYRLEDSSEVETVVQILRANSQNAVLTLRKQWTESLKLSQKFSQYTDKGLILRTDILSDTLSTENLDALGLVTLEEKLKFIFAALRLDIADATVSALSDDYEHIMGESIETTLTNGFIKHVNTIADFSFENVKNYMYKIATFVAEYEDLEYEHSAVNYNNDTIYEIENHYSLSLNVVDLKNNDSMLRNGFSQTSFGRHSLLLDWLNKDSAEVGSSNRSLFDIEYLDSTKTKGDYRAKNRKTQSTKGQNISAIGLFQSMGENLAKYIGITYGDSHIVPVFTSQRYRLDLHVDEAGNLKYGNNTVDLLYTQARNEIERISKYQAKKELTPDVSITPYGDYNLGVEHFILFPQLEESAMLSMVGTVLYGQTKEFTIDDVRSVWADGQLLINDAKGIDGHQTIKNILKHHINNEVEEQFAEFVKDGTIKVDDNGIYRSTDISTKFLNRHVTDTEFQKFKYATAEFVISQSLFNFDQHLIAIGDPAQFAKGIDVKGTKVFDHNLTMRNIQKRLKGSLSPHVVGNFKRDHYTKITIADIFKTSRELENYVKVIGEQARGMFTSMDISDAQEYTTVQEGIEFLLAYDLIEEEVYDSIMDKINNSIKDGTHYYVLDGKELEAVLNPTKPIHFGLSLSAEYDLMLTNYVKSSAIMLLPQLTNTFQIDDLRVYMEKNGVDRAAFVSAEKAGVAEVHNVFDAEGNVIIGRDEVDIKTTDMFQSVSRTNMGLQQFNPSKEKIVTVSQMNDLLVQNIDHITDFLHPLKKDKDGNPAKVSGAEMRKYKEERRAELFELGRDSVIEELGIEFTDESGVGEYKIINFPQLRSKIIAEAIRRNWSVVDLQELRLNEDGSGFIVPLLFTNSYEKVESLLLSIIRSRIISQKMFGKSFIQVSPAGFKPNVKAKSIDEMSTAEQASMYDQSILTESFDTEIGIRGTRIENGKVTAAQVMVAWNFRDNQGNLLDKYDYTKIITKEDENGKITERMVIDFEKLPKEVLQAIGARIPNQRHSTMMPYEIVGFLPDVMPDAAIVPEEIVVYMGSDFDVDKLYSYLTQYYVGENDVITKLHGTDVNYLEKDRIISEIDAEIESIEKIRTELKTLQDKKAEINADIATMENAEVAKIQEEEGVVDVHIRRALSILRDNDEYNDLLKKLTLLKDRAKALSPNKKYNDLIKQAEDRIAGHKELLQEVDKEDKPSVRKDIKREERYISKIKGLLKRGARSILVDNISKLKARKSMINRVFTRENIIKQEYKDIHWAILSHPKVAADTITSLDMKDLDIELAAMGIETSINPLSWRYQRDSFISQNNGKSMIGITSAYNRFNANIQPYKLRMGKRKNKQLSVLIKTSDKQEYASKFYMFSRQGNSVYRADRNDKGVERRKSDNVAIQQNAAVDNANNPLLGDLNINDITINASMALSLLSTEDIDGKDGRRKRNGIGIPLSFNARLMTQPIMIELVNRIRITMDDMGVGINTAKSIVLSDMIESVTEEIVEKHGEMSFRGMAFLSPELLSDLRTNPKHKDYLKYQLSILTTFRKLDNLGTNLSKVSRVLLFPGRKAAGKRLSETAEYNNNRLKLADIKELAGIDEMLNGIEFAAAEKTTVALANSAFSPLFYHTSPDITSSIDLITDIMALDNVRASDIDKITTQIKTSIFSGTDGLIEPGFPASNYRRVLTTYNIGESNVVVKNAADLRNHPVSVQLRALQDIKFLEANPELKGIIDNKMIDVLTPSTIEKSIQPIYLISLNRNKVGTMNESDLLHAFDSLIHHRSPNVRLFAKSLVAYSYLTGGTFNPKSFAKYIPATYKVSSGIYNRLSDIEFNGDFNVEHFVTQYFQHHPNNVKKNTKSILQFEGNVLSIVNKDNELHYVTNSSPTFIKQVVGESVILYKLQGWDANNVSIYKRIELLGNGANNIPNVSEYSLSTSEKESDFFINNFEDKPLEAVIHTPFNWLGNKQEEGFSSIEAENEERNKEYNTREKYFSTTNAVDALNAMTYHGFQELGKFMMPAVASQNTQVLPTVLEEGVTGKARGNLAMVDLAQIKRIFGDKDINYESVLIHEILHSLTSHTIGLYEEGKLTGRTKRILDNIEIVRNQALGHVRGQGGIGVEALNAFDRIEAGEKNVTIKSEYAPYYGLTNLDEFMSEIFVDKDFQTLLNSITLESDNIDGNGVSLWSKIRELLVKLMSSITGFEVDKNSTLYYGLTEAISFIDTVKKEGNPTEYKELELGNITISKHWKAIEDGKKTITSRSVSGSRFFNGNGAYVDAKTGRAYLLVKATSPLLLREIKSLYNGDLNQYAKDEGYADFEDMKKNSLASSKQFLEGNTRRVLYTIKSLYDNEYIAKANAETRTDGQLSIPFNIDVSTVQGVELMNREIGNINKLAENRVKKEVPVLKQEDILDNLATKEIIPAVPNKNGDYIVDEDSSNAAMAVNNDEYAGYNVVDSEKIKANSYKITVNNEQLAALNDRNEFNFSLAEDIYNLDDSSIYTAIPTPILELTSNIRNRISELYSGLTGDLSPMTRELYKRRIRDLKRGLTLINSDPSAENIEAVAMEQLDMAGKVISMDKVNYKDLLVATRIIDMWSWDNAVNFMTSGQLLNEDSAQYVALSNVASKAKDLSTRVLDAQRQITKKIIKEQIGVEVSDEDVLYIEDRSKVSNLMLDISKSAHKLVQGIDNILKGVNRSKTAELQSYQERITAMFDKLNADPEAKAMMGKDYGLMWQEDINGERTGGMTNQYSSKYYKFTRSMSGRIRKAELLAEDGVITAQELTDVRKNVRNEWNKKSITIDIGFILGIEGIERTDFTSPSDYITYLKTELGESLASDLIDQAKVSYEQYSDLRNDYWAMLGNEGLDADVRQTKFEQWEYENSPIIAMQFMKGFITKDSLDNVKVDGYRYLHTVPRKYNTVNGKREDTGYYDKQYSDIMNNATLREFHKEYKQLMDELKTRLPDNVSGRLQSNFLAQVQLDLLDTMNGGVKGAIHALSTSIKNGLTNGKISKLKQDEDESSAIREPKTQRIVKKIDSTSYTKSLEEDERSTDLKLMINLFADMSINYGYKSKVEDKVLIMNRVLSEARELERTVDGRPVVSKIGKLIAYKDGALDIKEAVVYATDALLYGEYKGKDVVTKFKLYSLNPKTQMRKARLAKELERQYADLEYQFEDGKITPEEYVEQLDILEVQYKSLEGKNLSLIKMGEKLMSYTQLKGLGLNLTAGMANMVFGIVTNMSHANGRVDFGWSEYGKAFGLSLKAKSIRNAKENKIFNLVKKYDILFDTIDIRYGKKKIASNKGSILKRIANFDYYTFQTNTELIIQSSSFIAKMMKVKVPTKDGGEISLYDAYDNAGNIREDIVSEEVAEKYKYIVEADEQNDYTKLRDSTIQMNKLLHGNYDPSSPILMKRVLIGRMLLQFRSWLPEGFAQRFQDEHYDSQLGRDVKGRWVTYGTLGFKGSMTTLTRQILNRDITGDLKPVDVENMRKNLAEIATYIGMMGLMAMLKWSMEDDDDEEKTLLGDYIPMMLLNTLYRSYQDIQFYIMPSTFYSILRDPLPVTKTFLDIERAFDGTIRYITDDSYRGQGPLLKWTKTVPLASQGYKTWFIATEDIGARN